MATLVKFHQFVEDLAKKVHNLGSDSLKIYLTNTTPDVSADVVKADLPEISAGNGYPAGGAAIANLSAEQTAGILKLTGDDVVFTASGGNFGPYRYAVLYNATPSSPTDPLIGYWDYGESVTSHSGEPFTVDFDGTNGILQMA